MSRALRIKLEESEVLIDEQRQSNIGQVFSSSQLSKLSRQIIIVSRADEVKRFRMSNLASGAKY